MKWNTRTRSLAAVAAGVLVLTTFVGAFEVLRDLSPDTLRSIVAIETFVAIFALSELNVRVGYRRRDIAFLAIPLYGLMYLVRVLWRGAHLPNAYWIPQFVDSELYRYAAFGEFVELGASRGTSEMVALTLFPIDDEVTAGEEFKTKLQELNLSAADSVRATHVDDLEAFAIDTLQLYIELANNCGEPYYASRFGAAIDEGRAKPHLRSHAEDIDSPLRMQQQLP